MGGRDVDQMMLYKGIKFSENKPTTTWLVFILKKLNDLIMWMLKNR
jgi:hypothetical protein